MKSMLRAVNVNSQAALAGIEQPSHTSPGMLHQASKWFPVRWQCAVSQWTPIIVGSFTETECNLNECLSRLIIFFIEPCKCTWRSCIIFLCMRKAYPINPVISISFTLDALFHKILMLFHAFVGGKMSIKRKTCNMNKFSSSLKKACDSSPLCSCS